MTDGVSELYSGGRAEQQTHSLRERGEVARVFADDMINSLRYEKDMMSKKRESDIERKLKKAVEGTGALCLKFVSPGCTGVPDRIILLPNGMMCFAELKAPGQTERPRQVYVQDRLRRMHFTVFSSVDSDERIAEVVRWCEFCGRYDYGV